MIRWMLLLSLMLSCPQMEAQNNFNPDTFRAQWDFRLGVGIFKRLYNVGQVISYDKIGWTLNNDNEN